MKAALIDPRVDKRREVDGNLSIIRSIVFIAKGATSGSGEKWLYTSSPWWVREVAVKYLYNKPVL